MGVGSTLAECQCILPQGFHSLFADLMAANQIPLAAPLTLTTIMVITFLWFLWDKYCYLTLIARPQHHSSSIKILEAQIWPLPSLSAQPIEESQH